MSDPRKHLPSRVARRLRPACVAAALALALTSACDGTGGEIGFVPQRPSAPPNVLLIVVDTLRADRCGFGGYARPTTPFLDDFAERGTTFRTCWSPSPWTAPAHASLFTGLRPERHGLYLGNRAFLADEFTTVAEHLKAAGYATGCFTANDFISPRFGTAQGFDAFENTSGPPDVIRHSAVRTTDLASDWIATVESSTAPYFAFVNLIDPHAPYDPPAETTSRLLRPCSADEEGKARAINFPWTLGYSAGLDLFTQRDLALASDLYDAEIAHVDQVLRGFLGRLEDAGRLGNTLVVVTSDHGENLGEHHRLEHVFALDRTLLHVPLVVVHPSLFEPGALVDDVVRLEDVAPTVLDVCGVASQGGAQDLDGRSLLGPTDGRVARGLYGLPEPAVAKLRTSFRVERPERFLVSRRSVFDGRHHLVVGSDGSVTLHDVIADPGELRDVAAEQPELVAALRALLDEPPPR